MELQKQKDQNEQIKKELEKALTQIKNMEDQDRATVRIGYEDPANFPEELFEEVCK